MLQLSKRPSGERAVIFASPSATAVTTPEASTVATPGLLLTHVGLAADKYSSEEDLAEELKLPDPYVAVRMNRLS